MYFQWNTEKITSQIPLFRDLRGSLIQLHTKGLYRSQMNSRVLKMKFVFRIINFTIILIYSISSFVSSYKMSAIKFYSLYNSFFLCYFQPFCIVFDFPRNSAVSFKVRIFLQIPPSFCTSSSLNSIHCPLSEYPYLQLDFFILN